MVFFQKFFNFFKKIPQKFYTLPIFAVFFACLASTPLSDERSSNRRPRPESIVYGVAPYHSDNFSPGVSAPKNIEIVVVKNWILSEGATDAHSAAIESIIKANKKPYILAYITADTVKKSFNTDRDCDGDSTAELCQHGAEKIRETFKEIILPTYVQTAKKIQAAAKRNKVIVHIEPDWLQYTEHAQLKPLSKEESHRFRGEILRSFYRNCPNCNLVLDFSPWFDPKSHPWAKSVKDYYGTFDRRYVKYIGLVGRQFEFREDKIDQYSYEEMTRSIDLPLIVTSAYTFGGTLTPLDVSWLKPEVASKAKRMRIESVILSLDQADAYEQFIADPRKPIATSNQQSQTQK